MNFIANHRLFFGTIFILSTISLANGNFIHDLASVAYNELIGDINVITRYVPNIASKSIVKILNKVILFD